MLRITTLGPAGSNHEFVALRYVESIGVPDVRLALVEAFPEAVARLRGGEADCIVQCAAHPEVARTIGANRTEIFVVDTFIAPARPLAILTRRDIAHPRSIAFHPATRSYADLGRWERHVEEQSTVRVAEGLLAGRYDSGITAAEVARAHPGQLRVELEIAPPHDAWLVYATTPTCEGAIVAWRDSPGARLLRATAGVGTGK